MKATHICLLGMLSLSTPTLFAEGYEQKGFGAVAEAHLLKPDQGQPAAGAGAGVRLEAESLWTPGTKDIDGDIIADMVGSIEIHPPLAGGSTEGVQTFGAAVEGFVTFAGTSLARGAQGCGGFGGVETGGHASLHVDNSDRNQAYGAFNAIGGLNCELGDVSLILGVAEGAGGAAATNKKENNFGTGVLNTGVRAYVSTKDWLVKVRADAIPYLFDSAESGQDHFVQASARFEAKPSETSSLLVGGELSGSTFIDVATGDAQRAEASAKFTVGGAF